MAKAPASPKPERPTLGKQLEAANALLMAMATKHPPGTAQSVALAERHTGADSGTFYVKLDLIQREGEGDIAFLNRARSFARACLAVRNDLNALAAVKRSAGAADGGEG